MKTISRTALAVLTILPGAACADEAADRFSPCGEKGCLDDYVKAPDGNPRYVPIRGVILAAERESEEAVSALLAHGAAPSFEGNPKLKSLFSTARVLGQDNVRQLRCLELIAEARRRWTPKS